MGSKNTAERANISIHAVASKNTVERANSPNSDG
jgi:hypothetical protein